MFKQGLVTSFFAARTDELLKKDPSAHIFNEVLDASLKVTGGDMVILPESVQWVASVQDRVVTLGSQLLESFEDDYNL